MNRMIIQSITKDNVTRNIHVSHDNGVDSCIGTTNDEIWRDYINMISNDRETCIEATLTFCLSINIET